MKVFFEKYFAKGSTKSWSFWIATIVGGIVAIGDIVPQLGGVVPEKWMPWILLTIAVARVIKQKGISDD